MNNPLTPLLMSGIPDLFNPNEFTDKELLKVIYRDLMRLRHDFDEFIKNDNVSRKLAELEVELNAIKLELAVEKQLRLQAEKNNKKLLGFGAFLITAVQFAINYLFRK
jgi:hypothetical protein